MSASVETYFNSRGFQAWCAEIDQRNEEDFFGMLEVLVRNLKAGDAYSAQLLDMGYCFEPGKEKPLAFTAILRYLCNASSSATSLSVFQPVKVFQLKQPDSGASQQQQSLCFTAPQYNSGVPGTLYVANLFSGQASECFDDPSLERLNLLKPDVFVRLLASGFFPIGCPTRENTNQTLTAHDIAHMAGFLSTPHYARQMLRLFQHVNQSLCSSYSTIAEQQQSEQLALALANFDSHYSLRLYYLIEILCQVRNVPLLERVVGHQIGEFPFETCKQQLKSKLQAMPTVARLKYMSAVVAQFHNIIAPLGGESRDIFNRHRKLDTTALYSAANSKFKQNSLYSLYYDVKKAMQEWRSSHDGFLERFCDLCATFLAALIGTARLSLTDWVDGACCLVPNPQSNLFKYVDGLFDRDHLFWKAFCSHEFYAVANT